MIRGVIYKLGRQNTSIRGKKKTHKKKNNKKERKKKGKEKALLPLCSFHVKAPNSTPGCIICFSLRCPVMIRSSSSTFPQDLRSGFWLPA